MQDQSCAVSRPPLAEVLDWAMGLAPEAQHQFVARTLCAGDTRDRLLELLRRAADAPGDGARGMVSLVRDYRSLVPRSAAAVVPLALVIGWLETESPAFDRDLRQAVDGEPELALDVAGLRQQWRQLAEAMLGDGKAGAPDGSPELFARLARLGQQAADRRYRVVAEIGRGGMGVVHEVVDENLGRCVAWKHPRERVGDGQDDVRVARLLEEARTTAGLEHAGIVPVHEVGVDRQGKAYFTMRRVNGISLRMALREHARGSGEWPLARLLDVLAKVCDAIAYAHSRQVIHRDLKPDNVMVGSYGETYVMDWGLARNLGDRERRDIRLRRPAAAASGDDDEVPAASAMCGAGQSTGESAVAAAEASCDSWRDEWIGPPLISMDGDVLGTPCFMAPEQADGRIDQVGPPTDVYAIGAILYQILTGRMPYAEPGRNLRAEELVTRVLAGPPLPVRQIAPEAPPELVAICARAMMRDPAQRYPDMAGLRSDLGAHLSGRVVSAYESGWWPVLRKRVGRNRAAFWTCVVALAAALTVLVWSDWSEALLRRAATEAERASLLRKQVISVAGSPRVADLMDAPGADEESLGLLVLDDSHKLAHLSGEIAAIRDVYRSVGGGAVGSLPLLEDLREQGERLRRHWQFWRNQASLRGPGRWPARGTVHRTVSGVVDLDTRIVELCDEFAAFFAADEAAAVALRRKRPEGGSYGVGMARLEFLIEVARELHSEPSAAWSLATASIADVSECPRYGGLCIIPQPGLEPLCRNPQTGLWEFYLPASGSRPQCDPTGRPLNRDVAAITFVLLPGDEVWIGAQSDEPGAPRYDALAEFEIQPRRVSVEPFLISKYEVTVRQWLRWRGFLMIQLDLGGGHPVENLSWRECEQVLPVYGCRLPTGAEWEYAGRGGVDAPLWTGCIDHLDRLYDSENLADASAWEAELLPSWRVELGHSDGYDAHAPIGSLAPNPFGLFDVSGNVKEWTVDEDGHFARGGSFLTLPQLARFTTRELAQDNSRRMDIGLRPARSLIRVPGEWPEPGAVDDGGEPRPAVAWRRCPGASSGGLRSPGTPAADPAALPSCGGP